MASHLRQVGDPAAREAPVDEPLTFETFFEANRRRLYGAFCLITGNRQEAEEIVQEAFLKLWERWDRIAGLDDPAGFLHDGDERATRDDYVSDTWILDPAEGTWSPA